MNTEILKIKGMTCQNCVNHVTKALLAVSGVEKVSVSLEKGEANVVYNPSDNILSKLKQAVIDTGYEINN
ncbi:MAG: heavy-metal-associated domain-containing protein [Spirochaetota bacterium]|nr:heavy-metal-associated domain-containing protein [Spirochaetota bacterium]